MDSAYNSVLFLLVTKEHFEFATVCCNCCFTLMTVFLSMATSAEPHKSSSVSSHLLTRQKMLKYFKCFQKQYAVSQISYII